MATIEHTADGSRFGRSDDLEARLRSSLAAHEERIRKSIILNPVENVPFPEDLAAANGLLHGLYNTDKIRGRDDAIRTPMQFAGRSEIAAEVRDVYTAFAAALGASDATLRLLSGLHAHIVLFMAIARPGQSVLLLPTEAGGHVSGRAIVERLGLEVVEMAVDNEAMCVDIDRTLDRCVDAPDFVLVDRSEGLVYEDFTRLASVATRASVFDASQYLSNLIAGDYPNPLAGGFDLLVASTHKNFPGPQKALLATRRSDARWEQALTGISTYVSNMHVGSIYAAGLTLTRRNWIEQYSRIIMTVAVRLEEELADLGVPVVRRTGGAPPTHHLWIRENSRERAFQTFERLERCSILTNYRQLPYCLGHGLRLGVSAAVRLGMVEDDVPALAELIASARRDDPTATTAAEAQRFAERLWSRSADIEQSGPQHAPTERSA